VDYINIIPKVFDIILLDWCLKRFEEVFSIMATLKEEFEGFDFITPAKNIIAGNTESLVIYDDGSGLTGDFSEVDSYFNDEMIKCDRELNDLLEMI